jgi:uncharacterized membrane protein
MNQTARRISLSDLFVAFSLVFGLAMTVVTPPFQVPDEPQHLLRAYQISEFHFLPTFRDDKGGAELPTSIALICRPFGDVRYWGEVTSARTILKTLRIPLRPEVRAYYEFPNTAVYSPLAYLPQAIAVGIGRELRLTPLTLMYLARFANLLIWIGSGYLVLRLAPGFRRPMFLLMLMPMALYEAASVSADVTANWIALLLAAVIWRETMEATEERISQPVLISLCLLSVGLGAGGEPNAE